MNKPAAPADRSIDAVRSDAIDCMFAIDENTGSALTQLAPIRNGNYGDGLVYNKALGTGTPITTAWSTYADGICLDLANSGTSAAVRLQAVGAGGQSLTQGTFAVLFLPTAFDGSTRSTIQTSNTTSTTGSLRGTRLGASNALRFFVEQGVVDPRYDYTFSPDTPTLVVCRWGPRGWHMWANGTAMTGTNDPSAYTGPLVTAANENWTFGEGTTAANMKFGYFARWDVELEDWEVDKLWADFYHNIRSFPNKFATPCVGVYAPKNTTCRVKWWTQVSMTGTAYWRYRLASTPFGLQGATPSSSWSTTNAGLDDDREITSLTTATRYCMIPEWSDDNVTFYPSPTGLQYINTLDYVNSTTGYVKELDMGDDHVNSSSDGGIIPYAGMGRDILYLQESATILPNNSDGRRKLYYAWQYVQAMCRDCGDPSYITCGGDNFYFDSATANGINDTNTSMFDAATNWFRVYQHLISRAPVYMILGNHERTGKPWIWEDDGTDATAKQALRYWQIFALAPTGDVYPQGGENGDSVQDYLPSEGAIPPAFVAGATYAVGDIVKPTGTGTQAKTRAYRCTVGGVAGADNSSGWTRAIDATVTTGAVTFVCEYRYDSDVASVWTKDAAGYWEGPYRNYYAFEWAGVLRVFLDTITYQAWRDATNDAPSTSDYTLGPTQQSWYENVLANSSAVLKFVEQHHLLGGESIGPDGGPGNYARSSAADIGIGAVYAAQGISESPHEIRQDRVLARWGATCLKNHDHTFCLSESPLGSVYVTFPGVAVESMYKQSLGDEVGWNNAEMGRSYGTSQSLGVLKPDGTDRDRVTAKYNILGGAYTEYDVSGERYRVTLIQTGLSMKFPYDAGLSTDNTAAFTRQYVAERFIYATNVSVNGSDQIDIQDSLNATPRPMQVGLIVDASLITGTWYTTQLSTFYPQSTVDTWSSATYAEGDWIQPTTFTGTMGFADPGGASGVSEPTWTAQGTATTDGAITWNMCDLNPVPYTQFALPIPSVADVQLASTAPANVRPEYVPRVVYQTAWLTQTPNPDISLLDDSVPVSMFTRSTRTSVFSR